jgi:hypothetical protein
MFRTLTLIVAITLLVPAAPQAQAKGGVPSTVDIVLKVAAKFPWKDVLALLDDLGPGKTKPEVKARLKELIPQLELRVHSARIDVTVSDTSPGRLGSLELELSMPADVEYIVDLKKMGPENLKWDGGRKILRVKLPPVSVGNVSPRLDEEVVSKPRYTGMRYFWFNGAAKAHLERKLRREDYRPAAKAEAEKRLPDAVRAGRDQVKGLLKKLLLPVGSDVEVIVE